MENIIASSKWTHRYIIATKSSKAPGSIASMEPPFIVLPKGEETSGEQSIVSQTTKQN